MIEDLDIPAEITFPITIAQGGHGTTTAPEARVAMALPTTVIAGGVNNVNWETTDNFYELLTVAKTYVFLNEADGLSIQMLIANPVDDYLPTFPTDISWPDGDAQPPAVAPETATMFSFTRINGVTYGTYVENYLTYVAA